jgi:sugar (pentulose or hexulose) kinase
MTSYILGVDLGTTSVKACLLDTTTRKVVEYASRDHGAAARCDVPGGSEQVVS